MVGSVLGNNSQRANECRMAMFFAGFPETVPIHTINRQCSSGLQAVASVAAAIKSGFYDVGIAAGVESMSANPLVWEGGVNPRIEENEHASSCLMPMGTPWGYTVVSSTTIHSWWSCNVDALIEFSF